MVTTDWIFLAVSAGILTLGAILGFGKVLKVATSGILGIVISVILCYCFGGMILKIPAIQNLLVKIASSWTTKSGFFFEFLSKIHLEVVIFYILLFIIFQLLRKLIVVIIAHVVETDNAVLKVINKTFGAILLAALCLVLMLLAFQIIMWVQGPDGSVGISLASSKLLGNLYRHNPLLGLMETVRATFSQIIPQ